MDRSSSSRSFPDARKTKGEEKRGERQKRNALVFAGSQGPLGSVRAADRCRRSAELEAGDQTGLSGNEKHRVIRRVCDALMWRFQHQSSVRASSVHRVRDFSLLRIACVFFHRVRCVSRSDAFVKRVNQAFLRESEPC